MATTPHVKHLRRQRFSRLRKPHGNFLAWLVEQGDRLSIPPRALRDLIRNIGPLYPREIAAGSDASDVGAVVSTAATVNFVKRALDARLGAFSSATAVRLGVKDETEDLRLGATSGSITVDFVAGQDEQPDEIVRATGSFVDDGFRPGCTIALTGAEEGGNAGPFVVVDVEPLKLYVANSALTADTEDSGVTITSLNVITGLEPGAGFVAGALLNVLGGAEAGQYEVAEAGEDFVIIDDGSPFSSVVADYDDGLTLSNVIVRASGSFIDDGFWTGGTLTIADAADGDNDGAYEIAGVFPLALVLATEFAGALDDGPDGASIGIYDQIKAQSSDWDTEGIGAADLVYAGSLLVGEVASLAEDDTTLVLDGPIPSVLLGQLASVGTNSQITRDSGSFVDDGFANNDKVQVVGADANDGVYRLSGVAATILTLDGESLAEDDAAVAALVYKVAENSRD